MDFLLAAGFFTIGVVCGAALLAPTATRGLSRILVEIRDDLRRPRA